MLEGAQVGKEGGGNFYRRAVPAASLSELPTYFSLFWRKKSSMTCTRNLLSC